MGLIHEARSPLFSFPSFPKKSVSPWESPLLSWSPLIAGGEFPAKGVAWSNKPDCIVQVMRITNHRVKHLGSPADPGSR